MKKCDGISNAVGKSFSNDYFNSHSKDKMKKELALKANIIIAH
jgi:predicted metalloendopeptidase